MLRYFFDRELCCHVCFLRKLWVWGKILKFVKPWEMKNLPSDREKNSENVWHTVKPWELRGLKIRTCSKHLPRMPHWWLACTARFSSKVWRTLRGQTACIINWQLDNWIHTENVVRKFKEPIDMSNPICGIKKGSKNICEKTSKSLLYRFPTHTFRAVNLFFGK